MSTSQPEQTFGRHVFAGLSSTAFLTIVPITFYIAMIVWSGDLGGPLNLILIPVGSMVAGALATLLVFLPVGLVSEHFGARLWLPAAIFVALASILLSIIGWETRLALLFGYLVVGLFVYLRSLSFRRASRDENPA